MISIAQSVLDILASDHYEVFFLLRVGDYRATNYFRSLIVDPGLPTERLFTHDGRIVSLDPPHISTSVDREIYRVVLADPGYAMVSVFGNIVGKDVEVYMGVTDAGTPLVSAAEEELILLYKGKADSFSYEVDTAEAGEVRAVVACASPMADLDGITQLFTSKTEIRNIDPSDTSFEHVYEGSGKAEFLWGKKTG
jgi:hypothetical protein